MRHLNHLLRLLPALILALVLPVLTVADRPVAESQRVGPEADGTAGTSGERWRDALERGEVDSKRFHYRAGCSSSACVQCRAAGYTEADDTCSFDAHRARIYARERYLYRGVSEGHDGASNLLTSSFGSDICTIHNGTCSKNDEGCPFELFMTCSGSKPGNVACRSGESCVGEWSASYLDQWRRWSETSVATVRSFRPVDCDCSEENVGHDASWNMNTRDGQIVTRNHQTLSQTVADAGSIETKGWYARRTVETAVHCGPPQTLRGQCDTLGLLDFGTVSETTTWGDPYYQ